MVKIGAELPKLSQKLNWVSVFGPPCIVIILLQIFSSLTVKKIENLLIFDTAYKNVPILGHPVV